MKIGIYTNTDDRNDLRLEQNMNDYFVSEKNIPSIIYRQKHMNAFFLKENLLIKAGFKLESLDEAMAIYYIEDKMINKTVNNKKEGYWITTPGRVKQKKFKPPLKEHTRLFESDELQALYEEEEDALRFIRSKWEKENEEKIDYQLLKSFHEYKNGEKCAEYEFDYFKGIEIITSKKYFEGQLHGEMISGDLGGYYKYGIKEGYWNEKSGRGFYTNGLKDGPWHENYGSGLYNNGNKINYWQEETGSGYYKDGKKNGEWVIFENPDSHDPALKRPIKVMFERGKQVIKDGRFTIDYVFISKKRWAEGQFKNGIKTGKWIYYYPSGKICSEIDYDKGSIVKERNIVFNKNNILDSEIIIKKDKRQCIYFHKNGKISRTIEYSFIKKTKRWLKNGLLINYDSKGKKIDEIKYINDEII